MVMVASPKGSGFRVQEIHEEWQHNSRFASTRANGASSDNHPDSSSLLNPEP